MPFCDRVPTTKIICIKRWATSEKYSNAAKNSTQYGNNEPTKDKNSTGAFVQMNKPGTSGIKKNYSSYE